MRCPACDHGLTERNEGEITVDVCEGGCGGIWFDPFELERVDEPHESVGEPLLYVELGPDVRVDHSARRMCPRCEGVCMMRHFFSTKREVEVDECPSCGGFWLDCGELGRIREQFPTDAEREKAAAEYFSDIFDGALEPMRRESDEKLKKARKIAWMFRFICPSYYIPGKQDWGAF